MKALVLLKQDYDDPFLSHIQKAAYAAIVKKYSRKSFFFFAKYVLGHDLLTEQTHKRWCEDLQLALNANKDRLMRLKPRKLYKTTIYGVSFVLWVWGCIDHNIKMFYTSSSSVLIAEVSDAISGFLGTNKNTTFYSSIFGIMKDIDAKNTEEVINIKGRTGKGFSLILRTSGGSTTGVHPNIVIADDVVGEKDRASQAERRDKEAWFETIKPLLVPWNDPNSNMRFETILYIGTVWHFKDLTYYIREKNKELPENEKWDVEIESIYKKNEKPKSNYPEMLSDEDIAKIKRGTTEEMFACHYENNALPDELIIFDLSRLTKVRYDQVELSSGQLLCVFDPSLGKKASDYPAVWWTHFYNGELTFIDAIDKKTELALLIYQIAQKNLEYGCPEMIYESNGTMLMDKNLKDAHIALGHRIYIHSIHHSSEASKYDRIISMQPHMYSGAVRFMADYEQRYPEAMNQVVFYPAYGPDDFPDCAHIAVEHFMRKRFEFKRYESIL